MEYLLWGWDDGYVACVADDSYPTRLDSRTDCKVVASALVNADSDLQARQKFGQANGFNWEEKIICPHCQSVELATVERAEPFNVYLHECQQCSHIIMESEWEPYEEPKPKEPIRVWVWDDAPEEYRNLSQHGGDETWVALVPPGLSELPYWIESKHFGQTGSMDVLPDGSTLCIGAHC
jgi:hypothetical protein